MIYSESSISRSDLILNLQTSMDDLTLLNSYHRIILSCTKSVRVLFERKKSNRLKPQDVTYNGQVRPSLPLHQLSSFGITFDSVLTFRTHFRTISVHWERIQTLFISRHFLFHHSSTTTANGSTLTFHPSMTKTCT